ncbi:MAG: heme ABC exporter ATP-binding protein CcmA [Gammaproteobacteria bacterium]|nr:heme ABC exporter ATP-binding protein CcmA [Gammaproteobacteria bacterium]
MSSTHLTVRNLHCRPGSQELFDGLSMSLVAGETIELRGPNGCGKSTLLRIMAGLQQPDSGDIARYVDPIGYLGHKFGLASILTVQENLRWTSTLIGSKLDTTRARELLETFELRTEMSKLIQELSAGQKRRCSFVCLLIGNYKLWLLDEPFSSLDSRGEKLVRELIEEHCRKGGSAVIASHSASPIAQAVQVELGIG